MAKEKTANELSEIMSEQLDILTSERVTEEERKTADSVSNMIGKLLKHDALRLAYPEYLNKGGKIIVSLETD